jgi:integrase
MRGVPASVIGLQLGHADGQTVERVYGKHRGRHAAAASLGGDRGETNSWSEN